jgi:hypothetical protein
VGSGASVRRHGRHAGVLDPDLLAQHGDLAVKPIALGSEAHAVEGAVGGPSAHMGEHEVGEGDDVQSGGLGVPGPGHPVGYNNAQMPCGREAELRSAISCGIEVPSQQVSAGKNLAKFGGPLQEAGFSSGFATSHSPSDTFPAFMQQATAVPDTPGGRLYGLRPNAQERIPLIRAGIEFVDGKQSERNNNEEVNKGRSKKLRRVAA